MKKGFFVAIVSLIIVAGFVTYFLIPSPLILSGTTGLPTSTNGAYKSLTRQDTWDKISPENFNITKRLLNTVELQVNIKNETLPLSILIVPDSRDSVTLQWRSSFPFTKNPITKISQYAQAINIRDTITKALNSFRTFVSDNKNIYDIHISETSTRDTFLISKRFTTKQYPSNEQIYTEIEKLKVYAAYSGAKGVAPPMLNVSTNDSLIFNCMVALPIDKIVEGNHTISFIRMIPGKFLTAEVTGGPYTILHAHKMMQQYFRDYSRASMAIPFEYLVTDRLKEKDTSKWVTRIYGPVY